jgi:hypothetical protein
MAEKISLPIQTGYVPKNYAEIDEIMRDTFQPDTPIEQCILLC